MRTLDIKTLGLIGSFVISTHSDIDGPVKYISIDHIDHSAVQLSLKIHKITQLCTWLVIDFLIEQNYNKQFQLLFILNVDTGFQSASVI